MTANDPRLTVDCMVPFCGWSTICTAFDDARRKWQAHREERHR